MPAREDGATGLARFESGGDAMLSMLRTIAGSAAVAASLCGCASSMGGAGVPDEGTSYVSEDGWAKLDRAWGSTSAIDVDARGNVWVFERCGANTCAGSKLAPILEFDRSGKLVKRFGEGLFVFPHAIHVDREGNIFVADADGKDGKGHVVMKFSPEGKVLMTLGRPGVAGETNDTFNRPSAVVTAPNGDIFVADGHGGASNARIVKFSRDGKFIKAWGRKGTGPGEFAELHAIAMDSSGRVFVADRGNNRIQIFDQSGNFIEEWKHFGRPTAIYIDRSDTIYVSDHASSAKLNPGFRRGIRIGNVKNGTVRKMIPGVGPEPDKENVPEGIAVDSEGNIYGAEVALKSVTKYRRN
jgi:DNA-binding beta-propeller fold protein YncE